MVYGKYVNNRTSSTNCYAGSITTFRRDLFKLAGQGLEGEPLEFNYKGVIFHVTPDRKASKVEKLIGQKVVSEDVDLEQASRDLLKEMGSRVATGPGGTVIHYLDTQV